MTTRRNPKITLSLIILVFALPFLAAYVTYWYYGSNTFNTTNKGELIIPPINVNKITVNIDDQPTSLAALTGDEIRHRWLLIYLAPSRCDKPCTTISFYINQLQTVLGKNSEHLRPVMLQPAIASTLPETNYPNVTYGYIAKDTVRTLVAQMPEAVQPTQDGGIYLVDPHGYMMMYYATKDDAGKMLKDLQKLVKG